METTKNCSLKKPGQDDFYDVQDFDDNMETIDEHIGALESPVYEESKELEELKSGEPYLSVFGKIKKAVGALIAHIGDKGNPHGVTLAQLGAAAAGSLSEHIQNKSNPHGVTKTQVGLGNCDNTADAVKSVKNADELGGYDSRYYLKNAYADNSNVKQGVKFDKNASGNFFTCRPILSGNMIQITLNDAKELVRIDENGNLILAGDLGTSGLPIGLNAIISNYLRTFSTGGIAYIGQPMTGGTAVTRVAAVDAVGTKNYVPICAKQFFNSAGDTLTFDEGSMVLRARSGAQMRVGATQVVVTNNSYTAYTPIQASSFDRQSSRLVKENISDMGKDEMDKILRIRVVDFDYKPGFGEKGQHGVIAEQVEDIIPYAITTPDGYREEDFDESKGIKQKIKSVDYSKFVPYLIAKMQDQEKCIKSLQARVSALEKGVQE